MSLGFDEAPRKMMRRCDDQRRIWRNRASLKLKPPGRAPIGAHWPNAISRPFRDTYETTTSPVFPYNSPTILIFFDCQSAAPRADLLLRVQCLIQAATLLSPGQRQSTLDRPGVMS
jgi:hypothetical protein